MKTLSSYGGGGTRAEPGRWGPQSTASVRQACRRRRCRRIPSRPGSATHVAGPARGQPGGRERGATPGAQATASHTPEPRGEGAAEVGEGPGSGTGSETETGCWIWIRQHSGVLGLEGPVPAWRGAGRGRKGQEVWTDQIHHVGLSPGLLGPFFLSLISH